MSNKPAIPDKSFGGTFVYDKDGTLIEHTPATKPRPIAVPENAEESAPVAESEPASAEPAQSAKKRGK